MGDCLDRRVWVCGVCMVVIMIFISVFDLPPLYITPVCVCTYLVTSYNMTFIQSIYYFTNNLIAKTSY